MQALVTALFLAKIGYVILGIDLVRRAHKTKGMPEFYLGVAFVLNGLSYLFTDLPFIIENDVILDPFSYIGRIAAGLCALTIAGFTWQVFRIDSAWAKSFFWGIGAVIAAGLMISAFEGDWEGAYPLTYKGFWFEWAGGTVAFAWMATETLRMYSKTRKQVRVGLADPLLSNRFLLIGVYGVLATSTYPLFLWMYIQYEISGAWSEPMEITTGIVEVCSLVALWISFSAPAFYRRWVGEARAAS
jgi:hypothetical protein